MIYNFIVSNDKLSVQEQRNAISGNVNFYQCRFTFVDCIRDIKWYCVFKKNDNAYVVEIENDVCMIPENVLKDKGVVYVGVFGTSSENDFVRVSTNLIYIPIENGAYCSGETPSKPTPDFWETVEKKVQGLESNKVDKIPGKGLSTNDFTDEDKRNLNTAWIGSQSNLSQISEINMNLENIENQLSTKVDKVTGKDLSSNDYTTAEKNKLSELPSKTELDNDLSGKEDSANKITTLDKNSTDAQYPSAKAVYDELVEKLNTDEAIGKKIEQGGEVFNNYRANIANGKYSHAEGSNTAAKGECSHAEGSFTTASNFNSHAEGTGTTASAYSSHAEGSYTKASGDRQHVQGKYNKEDTANKYAHIVGNGTSNDNRSNAHTLDWDGNAWYQGDIRIGGTSYDDGKTVETETTVSTSTETTASITLLDNTEVRCAELTSLTVTLPETLSDSFLSSVVFKSGATATTVTVPSEVYCQGADCKNGAFLPKANKRYTMIFSYDGIMNCYIAAVPIQTAQTQSEDVAEDEAVVVSDESTVANDETVADEPESVTETSESAEEETEPNEVI